MLDKKSENPWKPEDEGDHFPIVKEWWTIETIFKTREDNKKWNLISSFSYKHDEQTCFFQYILFDISSKKYVAYKDIDNEIEKLSFKKNKVDLVYEKSSIKGLYPNYKIHIEDPKYKLIADIDYKAKSLPHWVAQNQTNGFLPIGLNYYRYGFLPNCDLSGTLMLKEKKYEIIGKGYIEHAYGNFFYKKPLKHIYNLKKTLSIYIKLGKWWLSENKPKIPQNIKFSSENNLFGYDWIWGVFDNNWSIFFGNSMFWISEGPSFGALYLTQDGKNYLEFCNLRFRYLDSNYLKKYDMYYPKDIEITGVLRDKKIKIRFQSITESYEYIDPYEKEKFFKAWVLCELPAKMVGYYKDKKRKINLKGDCKIVLLRVPTSFGHNSLNLNFLLPPKGVGLTIEIDSHYLKKQIISNIQLAPKPIFKLNFKKMKKE